MHHLRLDSLKPSRGSPNILIKHTAIVPLYLHYEHPLSLAILSERLSWHHINTRATDSDASVWFVAGHLYPMYPCLVLLAQKLTQQLLMLGIQM